MLKLVEGNLSLTFFGLKGVIMKIAQIAPLIESVTRLTAGLSGSSPT